MDFKVMLVFVLLIGVLGFVAAAPVGPDFLNITENSSWSGSTGGAEINISGGIISSINVSATMQNSKWKAFVGWVDGKFTLDDASDSSIYDWSLSSIGGQVYTTRASGSITWASIACASAGEIVAEDTALVHIGEDNISSSFSSVNTGTYVVSGVSIGVGDCSSANSYVSNESQSASFEEFILYDTSNIVFATEIEDAVAGYDGADYDFQMIVPENASESFSGSTAYYLYVEIVS